MNKLNSKMIYQVFVRNHSATGDFQGLIKDLNRIKELGSDIIYLMPIHPISVLNRKGTLGSSYAVADYYGINPEYGDLNDFKELLKKAHKLGLKVWMDIVINHTGCDNVWVKKHPNFYYRKENGRMGNKVGEWTDIYDLSYQSKELQAELIKMLKYWAKLGVDGYRCDVASLVPLSFWLEAKSEIAKINKDFVWLAESVHPHFILDIRFRGFNAHSDCELYQAFDLEYDYDIYDKFLAYFKKEKPLIAFKEGLARQESTYPANYLKIRCLENHDQPRIHKLTDGNVAKTFNWLAYSYFAKGTTFVYAGQECLTTEFTNQFEDAKIKWEISKEWCELANKLKTIKQSKELTKASGYVVDVRDDEVLKLTYYYQGLKTIGIFNVGLQKGSYPIELEDGDYLNLINDETVTVKNKEITLGEQPLIIKEG